MGLISGETVYLHVLTQTGVDAFNREIFEETLEPVDNVLIAPLSDGEQTPAETAVTIKGARCQLAIPKGDTHEWDDAIVEFWGHTWKSVSYSTLGMEHLIPLSWNRKVTVERYG